MNDKSSLEQLKEKVFMALAEERAKPTPAGLVEELRDCQKELSNHRGRMITHDFVIGLIDKIISRYDPTPTDGHIKQG